MASMLPVCQRCMHVHYRRSPSHQPPPATTHQCNKRMNTAGRCSKDSNPASNSEVQHAAAGKAGRTDPSAGFQAPEGQPPLWWLEKFEERRKALEAEPQGQQPATSNQGTEAIQHQTVTPSNSEMEPPTEKQTQSPLRTALQALQLGAVLFLLLLFPASLQPAGLYSFRLWFVVLIYGVFFSIGALKRQAKYGALAKHPAYLCRSEDKQRSTLGSRFQLLVFIVSVVLLHWLCVVRASRLYLAGDTWYEVLSVPMMLGAVWLHRTATKQLGAAWDRIVTPPSLITTGVYKHVQHPIYTSYMMLFCGLAMFVHSAPYAILFLLCCLWHYRGRTQLEEAVLDRAFGAAYTAYKQQTPKKYIPFLI